MDEAELIAKGWKPPVDYDAWRPALAAYNVARDWPMAADDILRGVRLSKEDKNTIEGLIAAVAVAPHAD